MECQILVIFYSQHPSGTHSHACWCRLASSPLSTSPPQFTRTFSQSQHHAAPPPHQNQCTPKTKSVSPLYAIKHGTFPRHTAAEGGKKFAPKFLKIGKLNMSKDFSNSLKSLDLVNI